MAAQKFHLLIWEDGKDEPVPVVADQRDCAAFEVEYRMGFLKALEDMQITLFRFLGWHAARRTGLVDVKTKRADWDAGVIEVEVDKDAEDDGVDPGSPAASEGTS